MLVYEAKDDKVTVICLQVSKLYISMMLIWNMVLKRLIMSE